MDNLRVLANCRGSFCLPITGCLIVAFRLERLSMLTNWPATSQVDGGTTQRVSSGAHMSKYLQALFTLHRQRTTIVLPCR